MPQLVFVSAAEHDRHIVTVYLSASSASSSVSYFSFPLNNFCRDGLIL